ncbi:MAG: cellulase family glycosylhydrolase [Armatimonadetes bacterium]|nr:cellulase family glycosylhydrolase [Armatimonadota bacterium]
MASAMFFSSLASVSYGQGSPPENPGETEYDETYTDPLPVHLRHGINLDGIYQADWEYKMGRPCYDMRRLSSMLLGFDFEYIAQQGFDHVRIPISPIAFGAKDQTGQVDPNYEFIRGATDTGFSILWPVGYKIKAQDSFNALATDIIDAQVQGLDVIIDCHPWAVSEVHWNDAWVGESGTTPSPTGTYLENFCTSNSIPSLITSNHPLPKFWDSFLAELKTHLEISSNPKYVAGQNVFKGIHFEILNEPMVNFWGQFKDSHYGPKYSVGVTFAHDNPTYKTWLFDQLANWKAIQAQTIKAIYSRVNPADSRVIVSTLTNLVDSYGLQRRGTAQSDPTFQFSPFVAADMTGIGGQVGWSRRLIYAYHPYLPFRYTHEPGKEYLKRRDYYDDLVFHSSFFYLDNIWETGDQITRIRALPYMTTWQAQYEGTAMLATEVGAIHPTGLGFEYEDTEITAQLRGIPEEMRDKWLYDIRTSLESMNSGWTIFGYTGTWGMTKRGVHLENFWLPNYPTQPIYSRSETRNDPELFSEQNISALFGDSRPGGPNDED